MDSLLPCKDLTFRGIGHLDYARVAFLSKPKHTLSLSLSFPPPTHTHRRYTDTCALYRKRNIRPEEDSKQNVPLHRHTDVHSTMEYSTHSNEKL